MQKSELEAMLADKLELTKATSRDIVNAILEQITRELSRGQRVSLPGFGVFEVRAYAPRTGRNPQTGEAIEIPAGHTAHFKPGKALKDAITG